MNINRFDDLLIKANHCVALLCGTDLGNRDIYKPIYQHDVVTLTRQYLSVRRVLIQNRTEAESRHETLTQPAKKCLVRHLKILIL